jgi:hypothetical protein
MYKKNKQTKEKERKKNHKKIIKYDADKRRINENICERKHQVIIGKLGWIAGAVGGSIYTTSAEEGGS